MAKKKTDTISTLKAALLLWLETAALIKRREAELEVTELKMLIFSLEVTVTDGIKKEHIRKTARLRWFGLIKRRDGEERLKLYGATR